MKFQDLPKLGDPLDGGMFCGVTTLKYGTHAAVILLPNKAQERMDWETAIEWAVKVGGQLPSRHVAAMLYANAKGQFDVAWYWTADELSGDTGDKGAASYAWYCDFDDGFQLGNHKSFEGCARAVRLITLE